MHRKQKASFAHISRSESMTALKPGVNLPLKEKKTTKGPSVWCFFCHFPLHFLFLSWRFLYETAPAACPALAPEAWGSHGPLPVLGLCCSPFLSCSCCCRRRWQGESAGSTAADRAAKGPSFRNRYRQCRCPAAPSPALFPCNPMTYIPAWTLARFLPPLNAHQTLPPQVGTASGS